MNFIVVVVLLYRTPVIYIYLQLVVEAKHPTNIKANRSRAHVRDICL